MKAIKYLCSVIILIACAMALSSFLRGPERANKHFKFPYKDAGLTEREAAAHLLNRFTYGATPGQIDEVVKMGLETWFRKQLDGDLPDDSLNKRLLVYDALGYKNSDAVDMFPERGDVYKQAAKEGYISPDSINTAKDKAAFNERIQAFMRAKSYRPEQELYRQFDDQKILRATYSNNQLHEVLTDFWFNHFNVSFAKNGPGKYIPGYERDVIRPRILGPFDELLLATAKSPAMLHYLDNINSVGAQQAKEVKPAPVADNQMMMMGDSMTPKPIVRRNVAGLNENYAREVMELHTLGVDGGYTQSDVTNAAKVLTGWTVFPMGKYSQNPIRKQYDKYGESWMNDLGYVHEGDFLFNPTRHDKGEKTVLGHHFGKNGGYQEGVDLLEMLAHNPATAKFITRKLAVRFVSDNPPQTLLDKMSKTFTEQNGDIQQVIIAMVSAPEFWGKQALREKTKSPFELAISSIRSLNADVKQPGQVYNWVARMGQKLYYYLAPTGFPDRGTYWINTGALLNRMNFGLALSSNRIPGVVVNLEALNDHHEPESPEAALNIYSKLLIPERNLDQTIKRLTPMLTQPDLATNVGKAADNTPAVKPAAAPTNAMTDNYVVYTKPTTIYAMQGNGRGNNSMLSQVVGIIIGSPEYQRR